MKLPHILLITLFLLLVVFGAVLLIRSGYTPPLPERTNIDMLKEETEPVSIHSENVMYGDGVTGFLAWPEEQGHYPGVVLVHEWWGLNEQMKEAAQLLAAEGYAVLAVDLYNGEVAETAERARELRSVFDQEAATRNMQAATEYLRVQTGAEKVAAWGYCFGGGQALQLSLSGEPLDATVIYYGQLTDDPDALEAVDWPVLGVFGSEDTSVTPESVNAFEQALFEASVVYEIERYEGVGHAFANPSGANYAPEETMDAWEKTLAFLRKHLKE